MRTADRISRWITRKLNSHRFGIPFTSSRKITVPSFLNLGGKIVHLKFPEEHGIRADFTGIFLDDCYGLQSIKLNNSVPKILDVGANIGLFSLAARLAFPQAVIHAYEPNFQLKLYLDHH